MFSQLFFLLFIVFTIMPMLRQRYIHDRRIKLIRQLEKKNGTRVITLIHRQEGLSLLGIPITRFIDIEDSEAVLRAIRLTPDDLPIDIILHTPGGLVLAAEQIAFAIQKHPARVRVLVPHHAMSGGTLIALAADEIVLDPNAVLGPIDPQLGQYPAVSILETARRKSTDELDDKTLILADVSEKALHQVESFAFDLLKTKMDEEQAGKIAKLLAGGRWTHDFPLTFDFLRTLGLKVHDTLPSEVYTLMNLYPQPPQRRPSVMYIPTPYDHPGEPANKP